MKVWVIRWDPASAESVSEHINLEAHGSQARAYKRAVDLLANPEFDSDNGALFVEEHELGEEWQP